MLFPMVAMVLLTFAAGIYMLSKRISAVKQGSVKMSYWRVQCGAEPPEAVLKAGRHYSNLFEMPVLFYAACVTALALDLEGGGLLALAWLFVAARIVHTLIHLGYNNVSHRLAAFMLGNLALLGMWGLIVAGYARIA
jgi:hypothetical protein